METNYPFRTRCKSPANRQAFDFVTDAHSAWATMSEHMQGEVLKRAYRLLTDRKPHFGCIEGGRNNRPGQPGTANLHHLACVELNSRISDWAAIARRHPVIYSNCFAPPDGGHHIRAQWDPEKDCACVVAYRRRLGRDLYDLDWRSHSRMLGRILCYDAQQTGVFREFTSLPATTRVTNQPTAIHEFVVIAGWLLDGRNFAELEAIYDKLTVDRCRCAWQICRDLIATF